MKMWFAWCVPILISACSADRTAAGGRIITPAETVEGVTWSEAERAKPIAVRALGATAQQSVSLIRLAGAEHPHTHDEHDLIVVLLSGSGVLHIGDRVVSVKPGDVMEIPRKVVHWAENTDPEASVVYAIFSPPYDGRDNRPVGENK